MRETGGLSLFQLEGVSFSARVGGRRFSETLIDREELLAFHKKLGNENCLDVADKPTIRITDEQAREAVKKISGCDNVAEFQKLTPINRDKTILKLRDQHLSLRQISRLTGVSLMIVRRIVGE